MAVKAKAVSAAPEMVIIKPINLTNVVITLIGDSSLICHAWSSKAKKMMLDKQMKVAKPGKEAKNPQRDFEESLYPHPDGGYGFPTIGIKSAAVDACSHVDGLTKVQARGAFHIDGEMVKIDGKATMREDMVRVGMGVADVRHRGEFKTWRTSFKVRINQNVLSVDQVINLFETAGFAIGIGEWRPAKDGQHGMFHVARSTEMENAA